MQCIECIDLSGQVCWEVLVRTNLTSYVMLLERMLYHTGDQWEVWEAGAQDDNYLSLSISHYDKIRNVTGWINRKDILNILNIFLCNVQSFSWGQDTSLEAVEADQEQEQDCPADVSPAGTWQDLVAVHAVAEADVDLYVHLLDDSSLVDHVDLLQVRVTAVVVLVHRLRTAPEYQLWTSAQSAVITLSSLTRILELARDVEAALHPDRTDPYEGVGPGFVQRIVLLTGVIVSLVARLHSVAPVHVIVGAHLEHQQPWVTLQDSPSHLGEPAGQTHQLLLGIAHWNTSQLLFLCPTATVLLSHPSAAKIGKLFQKSS